MRCRLLLFKFSSVFLILVCHDGFARARSTSTTPSPPQLFVRLMNGGMSAGRVEVYHQGAWGTVCDDGWDDIDATVTCRQLGFSRGQAWDRAYYGEGSGKIVLKQVACQGAETDLSQCSMPQGIGDFSSSCAHSEDAGVQCFTGGGDVFPVRLVDGNSSAGRLEVYHDSQWGAVCDIGFDEPDATVVCRQLGLGGGQARPGGSYGSSSGPVWLARSSCLGNESSIFDCVGNVFREVPICDSSRHAGVVCGNGLPTIRLAGSTQTSGRVEVYHNGQWGTVCENGWDNSDAMVACRQLGLTGGIARYFAFYGAGSGPIWLTDLACSGQESRFETSTCLSNFGWGDFSDICTHAQDAGVDCDDPTGGAGPTAPSGGNGGGQRQPSGTVIVGDIRLTGSPTEGALVEVRSGGTWGTICGKGWDVADGQVICTEMGFLKVKDFGANATYGRGSGVIGISDLSCVGSETSVFDCQRSPWGVAPSCSHADDAWVSCSETRFEENTLRLIGTGSGFRKIQLFKNAEWNYICAGDGRGWDAKAAKVVCVQMSGEEAIVEFQTDKDSTSGGGSRLRSLTCTGLEMLLGDCAISLTARSDCGTYAVVKCTVPAKPLNVVVPVVVSVVLATIIAIVVVVVIVWKKKKAKLLSVKESKDSKESKGKAQEEIKDGSSEDLPPPRPGKPVPDLELKGISDVDDTISRKSGGDVLEQSRAGRPLPAMAAPVDRLWQSRLAGKDRAGGNKLPPLTGTGELPPLKSRPGRISSATPRVFTPRSSESESVTAGISPRTAWRERSYSRHDGMTPTIPPPAAYEDMRVGKAKVKKKRKVGILRDPEV